MALCFIVGVVLTDSANGLVRVFKNKKMPGHMGDVQRTTQNLKVIKLIPEKNLLLVKGSVPGSKGCVLSVRVRKIQDFSLGFTMKFKLFKSDGSSSSDTEIKNFPTLDDGKGVDALRQCILAVRANQRQGNASTKTQMKCLVQEKIYRQKGLGTGRAGDKRAIQRTGGGVAFGPKPRSYNQKVNSKVRKLALTRALVDQASGGSISLIEEWSIESPKTKDFNTLLSSIGSEKELNHWRDN